MARTIPTARTRRRRLFHATAAAALLLAARPAGAENISYAYDELGRLRTVTYGSGAIITYAYDAAGNRTQLNVSGGPNQPPTAVDDSISTLQNTANTFDPRPNDSDPENDPLTITAKTNGSKGSVVINSGISLTYTPVNGQSGADSFTYTISDGQGGTDTATVSVTITVPNQPPTAVNDSITTAQGTAKTFDPRTNDTDPESNPLTITAKTNGSKGTVTINSGTSLTYTPAAGQSGADSFTYTISDGQGGTSTATVSVTITVPNPNQPPVAADDSLVVPEGAINWLDPRTNDTDPDGDSITIISTTNGTHGNVSIVPAGLFFPVDVVWYRAEAEFLGTDSFTYTISDGKGGTDTATVSVSIHPRVGMDYSQQDVTSGAESKTTFASVTVATTTPGTWYVGAEFDASEYTSITPAVGVTTYRYEIVGRPTSGGTESIIATGTFDIEVEEEEDDPDIIRGDDIVIEAPATTAGLIDVELRVWRDGVDGGIEGLFGFLMATSFPGPFD